MRCAYDSGLMEKQDLWIGGDHHFWASLSNSPSPEIRQLASKVSKNVSVTELIEDGDLPSSLKPNEETYTKKRTTIRTLNPDVQVMGEDSEILQDENAENGEEEIYSESAKVRTMDPDVSVPPECIRVSPLSELDTEYKNMRQAYLDRKIGKKVYRVTRMQ